MIKIKWFSFIRNSKYYKLKKELDIANLIIKGMKAHQKEQDRELDELKETKIFP